MSKSPKKPTKRTTILNAKIAKEDNNNVPKTIERQSARTFITWYKQMVDYNRHNLGLYLTDDAILEWFGRTIKTRKKVSAFLKYDMQCSRHDFTTIDSIDKVVTRQSRDERNNLGKNDSLANPLHSPELIKINNNTDCISRKRPGLRSACSSPEWESNCHERDGKGTNCKRPRLNEKIEDCKNDLLLKCGHTEDDHGDVDNKGDGLLIRRKRRKCVQITPPNCEVGQGDCASTSGMDAMAEKSHAALNAQLPKKAVECNGFIEFTRTRNNRSNYGVKWERKCKVQISYSEDPLNIGEYIIWTIHYTDESKCRRNLLAAFEQVAIEDENKKS